MTLRQQATEEALRLFVACTFEEEEFDVEGGRRTLTKPWRPVRQRSPTPSFRRLGLGSDFLEPAKEKVDEPPSKTSQR